MQLDTDFRAWASLSEKFSLSFGISLPMDDGTNNELRFEYQQYVIDNLQKMFNYEDWLEHTGKNK